MSKNSRWKWNSIVLKWKKALHSDFLNQVIYRYYARSWQTRNTSECDLWTSWAFRARISKITFSIFMQSFLTRISLPGLVIHHCPHKQDIKSKMLVSYVSLIYCHTVHLWYVLLAIQTWLINYQSINLNRHRPKNMHKGILGVFYDPRVLSSVTLMEWTDFTRMTDATLWGPKRLQECLLRLKGK